ncbi:MAG: hypothetical protein AB7L17_16140 [Ilumatobacteraceae bacterium]
MTTRDAFGHVERITHIPRSSTFARYGGGADATCTVTAPYDDYVLADGRRVAEGTEIIGSYTFVQGVDVEREMPEIDHDGELPAVADRGPLSRATKTFTVFCDVGQGTLHSREFIQVPVLDPTLDPRGYVDELRNSLDLDQPEVFTNPIVDTFGGLVTRYPTWLAIDPASWHVDISNVESYRGTVVWLDAVPRELAFTIEFEPNADKPSPAARLTIGCIPTVPATAGGGALPAFPVLPDQTEPGPNGPCMWTPPGPGTVTITAHTTYSITFRADGYSEPDDDYIRDSAPTTFVTGELTAVNTRP